MLNNINIVLGLILGSGITLNEEILENKVIVKENPAGIHNKQVYTCNIYGKSVLVFSGRKHFYEGSDLSGITENVRLASKYGVKNLIITNAAGGLNENFTVGDIMLISSYINFITPLKLENIYFRTSDILKKILLKSASVSGINISEGVYGCYPGPTYETRAEIRFQKKYGLDAAGMSTIPEINHALKLGMKVAALSVITNLLNENLNTKTSHSDVLQTALKASGKLNRLLPGIISELN